jgi:hypothetical protein
MTTLYTLAMQVTNYCLAEWSEPAFPMLQVLLFFTYRWLIVFMGVILRLVFSALKLLCSTWSCLYEGLVHIG